jgi:6-phosphogluconolactonase
MTRVLVFDDAESVARHAADTIAEAIEAARSESRDIHIALAGGSTPQRAYELLASVPGAWGHVHLWMGDERCVPDEHPDSNARMVRESLLRGERAEPPVLHRVPHPEVPEDAAWLYALELRAHIPDLVFDVMLLGMGPDGHTASLFPGHSGLKVAEAPCFAVRESPKPPPERVTMSLPVLRAARLTLLLVTGADKRESLARALDGDPAIPLALLGDGLDEVACDEAARGSS